MSLSGRVTALTELLPTLLHAHCGMLSAIMEHPAAFMILCRTPTVFAEPLTAFT